MRQVVDKRREWRFQHDFHRSSIHHLGFIDHFEQVVTFEVVVRIAGAIQVHLHRFGVKLGTVMEFHPRMQFDGVSQAIRTHLIAVRQHVHQLHVLVETEQALIERFGHGLRQRVVGIIGVKRGEVGCDGDHRIFRRPGRACAHCRQQHDGRQCLTFECVLHGACIS
ncbi:hypothetical protein D3C81_1481060 [compost metagenome]